MAVPYVMTNLKVCNADVADISDQEHIETGEMHNKAGGAADKRGANKRDCAKLHVQDA